MFRIETDGGGLVWSKAAGPGLRHEAALADWFAAQAETLVQPVLATDRARGWLLSEDGGTTVRDRPDPDGRPADQVLTTWTAILPRYAALQRRTAWAADDLVAIGLPDERPARYPEMLDRLLRDDALWDRVDAADRPRTTAARRRLGEHAPLVAGLSGKLAATVEPTIDHGDLHGNNVVTGTGSATGVGDMIRIFDWGDAVVAHPFATLTTTLGSFTYHAGLDLDGPELAALRDAYTAAWADVASASDLASAAMLAVDLGHIGKAAAWERAVTGLRPDEMAGFHGASAAWLADFADRLDRRIR